MIDFSAKELSELEALQVYGGSVNAKSNANCTGSDLKFDLCINVECAYSKCAYDNCSHTTCTHIQCM